jgi:hypothetical protein
MFADDWVEKKNGLPRGMPLQKFAFRDIFFPVYADFFNIDFNRV